MRSTQPDLSRVSLELQILAKIGTPASVVAGVAVYRSGVGITGVFDGETLTTKIVKLYNRGRVGVRNDGEESRDEVTADYMIAPTGEVILSNIIGRSI